MGFQLIHHKLLIFRTNISVVVDSLQQIRGTDIGCHNENRILKVYRSSLGSVIRPSSRTCNRTLNTSGCAFSTSSKRTTEYGFLRTASVAVRPRHIRRIPEALRSDGTRNISPYTHSYQRTILDSSSKRLAARAFASSVLPTPVGPKNRNEPIGLLGSLIPALERMMASVTFVTPSS